MTSLPVPPSRPCISIRARFALTPGLTPSYLSKMALTAGVTDMLASPESVRAPPIAGTAARQMLDSPAIRADIFMEWGQGVGRNEGMAAPIDPDRIAARRERRAGACRGAAGRPAGARLPAHFGRRQPCPAFGVARPGRGAQFLGD